MRLLIPLLLLEKGLRPSEPLLSGLVRSGDEPFVFFLRAPLIDIEEGISFLFFLAGLVMLGELPIPARLFLPVRPLIGLFFSERERGLVLRIKGAEPFEVTLFFPALVMGLLFSLLRCFFTFETPGELPPPPPRDFVADRMGLLFS